MSEGDHDYQWVGFSGYSACVKCGHIKKDENV